MGQPLSKGAGVIPDVLARLALAWLALRTLRERRGLGARLRGALSFYALSCCYRVFKCGAFAQRTPLLYAVLGFPRELRGGE